MNIAVKQALSNWFVKPLKSRNSKHIIYREYGDNSVRKLKNLSTICASSVPSFPIKVLMVLALISLSLPYAVSAQDDLIKEYSSDNRLLSSVSTATILENGLVIHQWEWNAIASALSRNYGASRNDGGYVPAGLIAQDVQAMYPDAVILGKDGFLRIDLPVLMEQDELIANMVLSGEASLIQGNFLADGFLSDCFLADC